MPEMLVLLLVYFTVAYVVAHFFEKRIANTSIVFLIVLWILANVADMHSTILFVSDYGAEREGNIIFAVLIREFGLMWGLVMVKGGMTLLFAVLFLMLDRSTGNKIICFTLSVLIYLAAIWNYFNHFFIYPHTIQ